MDPDQTAPLGAVWSGSILFACMQKRFEKFARIFSRRHKQTTFSDAGFLGALRVNNIIIKEVTCLTRGGWKISGFFTLSQKMINIFQKFFVFFFKVFSTYVYTLLPSSWELCILSADQEVEQFTAEIKTALVSYLFSVLETNKSLALPKLSYKRLNGICRL